MKTSCEGGRQSFGDKTSNGRNGTKMIQEVGYKHTADGVKRPHKHNTLHLGLILSCLYPVRQTVPTKMKLAPFESQLAGAKRERHHARGHVVSGLAVNRSTLILI